MWFSRDDDNVGGNTFVPSNTLLEPNNVIPSWEFGDEEKKEVSGTLRKVREKYDNIHKAVLAKDKELEMLKVRKHCSSLTYEICRKNLNKPSLKKTTSRILI